jgi:hypothetical protein
VKHSIDLHLSLLKLSDIYNDKFYVCNYGVTFYISEEVLAQFTIMC